MASKKCNKQTHTKKFVLQIVFSFWLPHRRVIDGKSVQLDFSPWQQFLIGVLQVNIEHRDDVPLGKISHFLFFVIIFIEIKVLISIISLS